MCFSLFFPLVLFERGNSLSFIYGIYGRENLFSQDHIGHKGIAKGSKSTSGLWSLVFVKALPIRPAYRPNFELRVLSFELFSASPAIVSYPILNWKISSYQFKTEKFKMRHGAQFIIQNSKFLTRTASAVRILSYSASKCLARSIIVSSPFSRSSCERPTL